MRSAIRMRPCRRVIGSDDDGRLLAERSHGGEHVRELADHVVGASKRIEVGAVVAAMPVFVGVTEPDVEERGLLDTEVLECDRDGRSVGPIARVSRKRIRCAPRRSTGRSCCYAAADPLANTSGDG